MLPREALLSGQRDKVAPHEGSVFLGDPDPGFWKLTRGGERLARGP